MSLLTSIGAVIGAFIIAVLISLWLPGIQRKLVQARVQQRLGPQVTSPGIFATGKFFFKQTLKPSAAMPRLYNALPLCTLIVVSAIFVTLTPQAIVSWGSFASIVCLVGLLKVEEVLYLFMSSLSQSLLSKTMPFPDDAKGGKHVGANKSFFEQISANRSLKLIVYGSLPLYIAVFIPAILAHSINFGDIINYQVIAGPILFTLPGLLGTIAFFIGLLVLLNEYPFSYLKGKSDVIEGPILEYMSKSRAVYVMAHAFLLFTAGCVFSTLFLGVPPCWGWQMIVPVITAIIMAMAAAAVSAFAPLFTNREFYPTIIATSMISVIGVVVAFL
jgi:energy-converting hydrogenase B subunit O